MLAREFVEYILLVCLGVYLSLRTVTGCHLIAYVGQQNFFGPRGDRVHQYECGSVGEMGQRYMRLLP